MSGKAFRIKKWRKKPLNLEECPENSLELKNNEKIR